MKLKICSVKEAKSNLNSIKRRSEELDRNIAQILEAVHLGGDQAVRDYTEKFDNVRLDSFEISREQINAYAAQCDPALYAAMERAAANIADFHRRQLTQSWMTTRDNGCMLGQRLRGLERVGIYVPGGTAAYPSSVLMCAIPAKIAGVKEIIMVTPPAKEGKPNFAVFAAAQIAGVDRIFTIGGAQAIAALAFGTETIPRVDKIAGPGNIYVATAKRMLYGTVDIDMVAGPSEILILADNTADAAFIAADMLSQAEHDRLASSVLVTTDASLIPLVCAELERQTALLPRREIIEQSLNDYGLIVLADTMDEAVEMANDLAPEHLEVMTASPFDLLGRLDNAGSIFLGKYAPEPLGDYYAGPNHVLPTGGTARFFSPLSVESFIKKTSFIYYTQDALSEASDDIITIAEAEGLSAHANSIRIRQKEAK